MRLTLWLAAAAATLAACSGPSAPGPAAAPAPPAAATPVGSVFPAGVQLGGLGLPVYPTPPDHIIAPASEPNGDGGTSTTASMDPHAPYATVLAWYTAHMPPGSLLPGAPGNEYAMFQIGADGDALIRIVIVQHSAGAVQTQISLIRKTIP